MEVTSQLSGLNISQPSAQAAPTLLTLPTEILLHILTFFNPLELARTTRPVCRRINSLALTFRSGEVYSLPPCLWEYVLSYLNNRHDILQTRFVSPIFKSLIDDSKLESIRTWLWRGQRPEVESKLDEWWTQCHPFLSKPQLRVGKQVFAKDSDKMYNSLGDRAHETATIPPVSSASVTMHFPAFAQRSRRRRDLGLPQLSTVLPRRDNNPNTVTVADVFIVIQKVMLDYWVDSVNIFVCGTNLYVTEGALTDELVKSLDEGNHCTDDIVGAEFEARAETTTMLHKNSLCMIDRGPRYGLFGRNNIRESFELAVVWDRNYGGTGRQSNWVINLN
ncbi:hypothetical protein TWF694_010071 [Orbilia ellipsospora]|uniref:F-box domain-containing protein n=1 Tax=Orbilia ellipsospora TaxID=2528407 RepID=A0AAV9XF46_9PEZI